MNMVMNILIRVPTPATTHQPRSHYETKGIKVKDHKEEKPDNNQKRLLGLYKLPNKSDWNEGMTEDEKIAFIDSMIKDMAEKLDEDPNE